MLGMGAAPILMPTWTLHIIPPPFYDATHDVRGLVAGNMITVLMPPWLPLRLTSSGMVYSTVAA
jgi:hypothetical protein